MKQTSKRVVAIVATVVLVMTCILTAVSSNLTFEAVATNGTLTPTAWVYLPYVSEQESSTPSPIPSPSPGAIVIDHDAVDADAIPQTWLDQARQLDILFTHKSVGSNIVSGLGDLRSADPGRYWLDIVYGQSATWYVSNDGLVHAQPGSNGDPFSKVDGFANLITSQGFSAANVAMMKFCYVDVPDSSTVTAIWTDYRDSMESLQANYPDVEFVWWTVPLGSYSSGENNGQRYEYNELVRQHCENYGYPLFDLADIESHDPSGNLITRYGYPAMYDGYTYDGGHLNETGRQRVARGLWWLLARVAGWQG